MATVYGTYLTDTLDERDGVTNGHDDIFGFDGVDYLYGLGGDDLLKGGGGGDFLFGGEGYDTADYRWSDAGVQIYLADGFAEGMGIGGTAQGDRLYSIEDLIGSDYADGLYGNSGTNFLNGGNGADILNGRGSDDWLAGGEGDDWLFGGQGADFLVGGSGYDGADYSESSVGVTVSLLPDPVTGMGFGRGGDAEGDTLYQVEKIQGSLHGDTLIGDNGTNTLFGLDGEDSLFGYGGIDILLGGPGRDVLTGGDDGDRFDWLALSETATTTTQMDVITDFNFAAGDRIDVNFIDADAYATGNQTFTFIGSAAFSGTPGEINYRYEGGNTIIQMQTGTVLDIEGGIVLQGIHTPTAAWFFL